MPKQKLSKEKKVRKVKKEKKVRKPSVKTVESTTAPAKIEIIPDATIEEKAQMRCGRCGEWNHLPTNDCDAMVETK